MRPLLWLVAASLIGATDLSAATGKREFARPPYAGTYEPQGVDERGIWMQFDEAERGLRDSPAVYRDEKLNTYVRSVLCRTVGFDRCAAVRIYVIKDSSFNATMAPNGLMVVHTGLLARLSSEAELAAVLGHEFAHFELRHSLQRFRLQRRSGDLAAWIGLAGAATGHSTTDIRNTIDAGYYSFSRENETEADLLSAAFARSSPYRLRGSEVWKRMILENDALREERKLRKIRRFRPGITDTHPTNLQRVAYLAVLEKEAAAAGDGGEDDFAEYRAATLPILPEMFDSLVKGNEFGAADYVIRQRGDTLGWDGQLLTLRAELYRQRAAPRDLATAREFFEKATTYADAPPESWRGLGLTAMRLGDLEPARAALAEYLKRLPDARDAASIRALLEN